ncbi:MAG TPA: excisionase family DNA-binding protein [Pyrinomonadaceae bacterium]
MKLISTDEAAERLGVSGRRVRQLIDEGKLAAQYVGGGYVIDETALEGVKVYGKPGRPPSDNGQKKASREALKRKALARWEGEGGKLAPAKKSAKKKGK